MIDFIKQYEIFSHCFFLRRRRPRKFRKGDRDGGLGEGKEGKPFSKGFPLSLPPAAGGISNRSRLISHASGVVENSFDGDADFGIYFEIGQSVGQDD